MCVRGMEYMCNKCVGQVVHTNRTYLIFQVMRKAVTEFEGVIEKMFGHTTGRHEAVDSGENDTSMEKVRTLKQVIQC